MVTSRFTKLFYCERPNIAHYIYTYCSPYPELLQFLVLIVLRQGDDNKQSNLIMFELQGLEDVNKVMRIIGVHEGDVMMKKVRQIDFYGYLWVYIQ